MLSRIFENREKTKSIEYDPQQYRLITAITLYNMYTLSVLSLFADLEDAKPW